MDKGLHVFFYSPVSWNSQEEIIYQNKQIHNPKQNRLFTFSNNANNNIDNIN